MVREESCSHLLLILALGRDLATNARGHIRVVGHVLGQDAIVVEAAAALALPR